MFQLTYLIIGITCLISYTGFTNPEVFAKLKHWPYAEARRGEQYRWLSGGFLHGDWAHLLFNMMTLYFFAADQRPEEYQVEGLGFPGLERWFVDLFPSIGGLMFVGFYLLAVIVASAGTYFKHKDNPGFASIGASGATAAVLFAAILIAPSMKLMLFFIPIPISGWLFGIIYLAYSAYAANKEGEHIDHAAHFYGAVFGFTFPLIFEPSLLPAFFAQITGSAM